MSYEDFTTFTEVDIAEDRIQKTANHIDHAARHDEVTYLYKDYGVDHFGDFVHRIKVRMVSETGDPRSIVWMLANDLGGEYGLKNDYKTLISFRLSKYSSDTYTYLVEGYDDGYTYGTSANKWALGDWLYVEVEKSGTALTAKTYSDENYSNLIDTLSLTLHGNWNFRYLYACNTYDNNDSGNEAINDIENFDINEVEYLNVSATDIAASRDCAGLKNNLTILDSMDSPEGWVAGGGITGITLNTTTKKECHGALNMIKTRTDYADSYMSKVIPSVNLTSKIVRVWVYIKDTATLDKISTCQIYLFSNGGSYYRGWIFWHSALTTGWNLLSVDTDTPPTWSSSPPADLSSITIIRVDVDTNNATDLYGAGDVIADCYSYSNHSNITDVGGCVDSASVEVFKFEDFTTFTEVDTASDRIQRTKTHVDHLALRNENTYLYKYYGTDYFGNFTHKIKVKIASADENSLGFFWMLANDADGVANLKDAHKSFIDVSAIYWGGEIVLYLDECSDGIWDSDSKSGLFNLGEWIYIKIEKVDDSLTAKLYSDPQYSTLVYTLSLTLPGNWKFKFLYACNTFDISSVDSMDSDIENFNIPTDFCLDSMDAVTGWNVGGGMTGVTLNTTTKKEGLAALNLIKGTSSTGAYIYKDITSANLVSKNVKAWVYIKDSATLAKISRIEFFSYDPLWNLRVWDVASTYLNVGWNLVHIDTDTPDDGHTQPPGDISETIRIRLDVDTWNSGDTFAEGDVIADCYSYSNHSSTSDVGGGIDSASGVLLAPVVIEDIAGAVESASVSTFHAVTAADIAGAIESASVSTFHAVTAADIAGAVESASVSTFHAVTAADIAGAVESVNVSTFHAVTAVDIVGAIESVNRSTFHAVTVKDIAGAIESGSSTFHAVTAVDIVGAIESASVSTFHAVTTADIAGAIESASVSTFHAVTTTDIAGTIEDAGVSAFHAVTVKDIAGTVESASRSAFHAVTTTDIAGASEGAGVTVFHVVTAVDIAGASEGASASGSGFHAVTAADMAGAGESVNVSTFHAVTTTDIAGTIEDADIRVFHVVTAVDIAGTVESASRSTFHAVTAIDIAGAIESVNRSTFHAVTAIDIAGAIESASVSTFHAVTAVDIAGTVESASAFHAVTATDIVGAIESASVSTFHAVMTEDIAGTIESASVSTFHAISAVDIAGAIESASVSTFHAVTAADIAGAVESASRSTFHAVTTTDIVGAVESVDVSTFHAITAVDIAGAIESASRSTFHAVTTTDIAGAIESGSSTFHIVIATDIAGTIESASGHIMTYVLRAGFFYAAIGEDPNATILCVPEIADFQITEVLCKIPQFTFTIANSAESRAVIEGATSPDFKIYWVLPGLSPTLVFSGVFECDSTEYISAIEIRITGYASYVDLNRTFIKRIADEDAQSAGAVLDYDGSYTDYTTQANNDDINDVLPSLGGVNHALYIGADFKFRVAKIKYSTKGVPAAGSAITVEFSQGDANWKQLDVSCESRFFTEIPGTYFLIIPHLPGDWERDTVNGAKHFWLRFRITTGAYTTPPKIDRIILSRADPYRVYFFNRPARSILAEVLEGTGYSMDGTDLCPTDEISLVAEYQTNLLLIPGIANALTWEDAEGKHSYQWWIDSSKKVHMKTKRGNSHGDLTGNLTLLHHFLDHFNISNKLHFMGNYGGINQIHALIEDTQSQDAWNTREIMVPEKNHNDYQSLKLSAEKAMVYTKDPLQKIPAELDTRYWLDNGFEVGDRVVLHQSTWGIEEREYQIVRAVIGPKTTSLDLGVSQEHLNALKADMQRKLDISDVRMSGSTSVFMIGPVNDNYEREDDGTVHPARLKIEIPEGTRYIHKVTLSWVLGPYRADVSGGGDIPAHDHGGFGGAGGAFTPEIEDGCGHNTSEGQKTLTIKEEVKAGYLLTDNYAVAENTHVHGMYDTGVGTAHKHEMKLSGDIITYSTANGYLPTSVWVSYDGAHSHPLSDTGGPSSTVWALSGLNAGDECATAGCYCVDFTDPMHTEVGSSTHTHANSDTDEEGPHDHYMSAGLKHYYLHSMTIKNPAYTEDESDHVHPNVATKPGSSHTHKLTVMQDEWGEDTYIPLLIRTHPSFADPGDPDEPEHAHDIVPTPDMPITGIPEAAHSDHAIAPDPGGAVALEYGIHEEPGGTTLELIINDETVGNQYNGNQTAIRIEGFLKAGSNTVALQPIVAEAGKKGGAAFSGAAFVFIEDASF